MSTSKPQFNVRLDPAIAAEIETYCEQQSVVKGKLVEAMWTRFMLSTHEAVEQVCNKLSHYVAEKPLASRDVPHLYKLMLALQRAVQAHQERG